MTDLRHKNILITGAASDVGKRLAKRCANDQAHLVLWDDNAEALNNLERELKPFAASVQTYQLDFSNREMIEDVAAKVLADVGHIDVLVNNAALAVKANLLALPADELQLGFDINALALLWVTRAFLPKMLERNNGHIMNVATAATALDASGLPDYCLSKYAVLGFDEALRLEMQSGGHNIRSSMVLPYAFSVRLASMQPVFTPDYVVAKMYQGLRNNTSKVVLLPSLLGLRSLALLPASLFRWFVRPRNFAALSNNLKAWRRSA